MMQSITSRDKVSPTRVGLPGELRPWPGCPLLGEVPVGMGATGKRIPGKRGEGKGWL